MNYRIIEVTHGDGNIEYKVQGRILLLWFTLNYYKGICSHTHVYKTKHEAENVIQCLQNKEKGNRITNTRVIPY